MKFFLSYSIYTLLFYWKRTIFIGYEDKNNEIEELKIRVEQTRRINYNFAKTVCKLTIKLFLKFLISYIEKK